METFLVLDADGMWSKLEFIKTPVGSMAAILRTMVAEQPLMHKLQQDPLALLWGKDTNRVILINIPEMRIKTDFMPNADGILVPRFSPREQDNTLDLQVPFRLPAGNSMWFAFSTTPHEGVHRSYLFWHLGTENRLVCPPLANLYADSQVCTGDVEDFPLGEGLWVQTKYLMDHIFESRWGGDLQPDHAKVQSIFRYEADGHTQLPPLEGALESLGSASGPYQVPFMNLKEGGFIQ